MQRISNNHIDFNLYIGIAFISIEVCIYVLHNVACFSVEYTGISSKADWAENCDVSSFHSWNDRDESTQLECISIK